MLKFYTVLSFASDITADTSPFNGVTCILLVLLSFNISDIFHFRQVIVLELAPLRHARHLRQMFTFRTGRT